MARLTEAKGVIATVEQRVRKDSRKLLLENRRSSTLLSRLVAHDHSILH
jgi:hypothetical protein